MKLKACLPSWATQDDRRSFAGAAHAFDSPVNLVGGWRPLFIHTRVVE